MQALLKKMQGLRIASGELQGDGTKHPKYSVKLKNT